MYKDLITQITKYLEPKIIYYPTLKIFRQDKDSINFFLYFTCEINGKIISQTFINEIIVGSFFMDKFYDNGDLFFLIGEEIALRSEDNYIPIVLFYINKKKELKIFENRGKLSPSPSIFTFALIVPSIFKWKTYGAWHIDIPSSLRDSIIPMTSSNIYKISKRDIELIEEAIEIIWDIVNSETSELDKIELSEKEKKYIEIYYQ